MIDFAILVSNDHHCNATIMIKCLGWTQDNRLLISNFASYNGLALENWFNRKLAIFLESVCELHL